MPGVSPKARRAQARPLPPNPRRGLKLGVGLAASLLVAALAAARLGRSPGRSEAGMSVLLVTVDTLRADALGAYGNVHAATPWIDKLASRGVRFDAAHAHNVVTLPSHANILSGRYPTEHGLRDNSGFRFPPELPTLATWLRARGYATGAFVSAFPLDSRFGLARGFDVYEDSFVGRSTPTAFLEQERSGPETVSLAKQWLDLQAGRPTFCWVHVYEPHFPYRPPPPFAARFPGDPYAGEVAAADAALAPLLEPLLSLGEAGRTLVVLTADHGESLGEHGEATHGIFAYEATLRVPLILYAPRLLRPRTTSVPARHVDVLPTVLDALGVPAPAGLPGRSLLPAARGAADSAPESSYFEALAGLLDRGWAPLHGVIERREKYVELPIQELYDLGSDAGETRNLAGSRPDRVAALRALLAPFGAIPDVARGPESAETLERLRGLGYVGLVAPSRPRSFAAEDDPKQLIGLDGEIQEVARLYLAGDLPAAVSRCRGLVARRPSMPISLLYLAHLERESGDLPAAIAALRKAVALSFGSVRTTALLGTYLTQAGRAPEAAALLEPEARGATPDPDILVARGLALAKAGRFSEALAELERARVTSPANAMLLVTVGTVRLMSGEREPARAAFRAAVSLNPGVASAWGSLGVMAAEDGKADEAKDAWKRAIALDPREAEKVLAIASLLWQKGRRVEARPYLELFLASTADGAPSPEVQRVRGWLSEASPPRG
jgi:tetratricopeptide (TPR) repeat protein